MLQQTQVKTVIPYFKKFIKKFPSIQKLANSKYGEVLKQWAGLGYYRRAKSLYETAKILNLSYKTNIPSDYEKLKALPGIGDYTASAILAIGFNKTSDGADTNINRVVTRVFYLNPKSKNYNQNLIDKKKNFFSKNNYSITFQGLMELGALVCKVKNPKCTICPLRKVCLSVKRESLPTPVKKNLRKIEKYYLLYASSSKKVLFFKNNYSFLKGFHNLPLLHYKHDLFNQSFMKNNFSTKKKIIQIPNFIKHQISNKLLLLKLVIMKDIQKIKNKDFYWVSKNNIRNKLLSNFSKKFLKMFLLIEKIVCLKKL